jgi:hypothetical protein
MCQIELLEVNFSITFSLRLRPLREIKNLNVLLIVIQS